MPKMMKKRFKIFLLLLLIFIIYIFYSTNKINGVWIEAYSFSKHNDSISFRPTSSRIIEINNGKIKIHPYSDELKGNFLLFNNHFYFSNIYWNSTLKTVNKDSMVIFHNNPFITNRKFTMVYKRIPTKYKSTNNYKLTNKFFKSENENNIDTLYFDEKFLIVKTHKKINILWENVGLIKHKSINGFDVFLSPNSFNLIFKQKENKFYLYFLNNMKFTKIELTEIVKTNELEKQIKNFLTDLRKDVKVRE